MHHPIGPPTVAQDKQAERHFYDRLFRRRGRFDQFQREIYEQMAAEARSRAPGTLALDLGCGAGDLALCLLDQGFFVVAADLSLEAAKLCRGSVANRSAVVVNADAELLPVRDGSIDACICGLLLHHFASLDRVAAELQRVVKPGGVVIALDANGHNPFVRLFLNAIHRVRPLSGLTPNQRALRCSEIERVFQRFGFCNFQFHSLSSRLRRDWLGSSLGAWLNFCSRALTLFLTNLVLPRMCRGNMLLSIFQRLPEAGQPPARMQESAVESFV